MLTDTQRAAVKRWYQEDECITQVRSLIEKAGWLQLEEYVQMIALFPLSRHDTLPEYMRDEEGKPLFKCNLNPRNNLEGWRDAIEIGWQVMEETFKMSRDELHIKIRDLQEDDWDRFVKDAEARVQNKRSS